MNRSGLPVLLIMIGLTACLPALAAVSPDDLGVQLPREAGSTGQADGRTNSKDSTSSSNATTPGELPRLDSAQPDNSRPMHSGDRIPGELDEGFTAPIVSSEVAASEPGTVQEILVRQGQVVRRGDPLAVLAHEVLKASLEVAAARCTNTAKRDAAVIELNLRQKRCDNLAKLGEKLASPEELDRATADRDLARTEVTAAEQELKLEVLERKRIEAQLDQRTIRSPIDGVVIRLHREPGEYVSSAEPVIATVADLSRLRIVLHPPSRFAESLKAGDPVPVRMLRSGDLLMTQVVFVSPLTDADSGSVRLELTLDNADQRIRSGLRCSLDQRSRPPQISGAVRQGVIR